MTSLGLQDEGRALQCERKSSVCPITNHHFLIWLLLSASSLTLCLCFTPLFTWSSRLCPKFSRTKPLVISCFCGLVLPRDFVHAFVLLQLPPTDSSSFSLGITFCSELCLICPSQIWCCSPVCSCDPQHDSPIPGLSPLLNCKLVKNQTCFCIIYSSLPNT